MPGGLEEHGQVRGERRNGHRRRDRQHPPPARAGGGGQLLNTAAALSDALPGAGRLGQWPDQLQDVALDDDHIHPRPVRRFAGEQQEHTGRRDQRSDPQRK